MEGRCCSNRIHFNMSPCFVVCTSLLISCFIWSVTGHGRLMEPPSRSSLWRYAEFADYNPPVNYNDNELFCGGVTVQYEQNDGKCGECGDAWNQPRPRDNEDGGKFGRGIIVAQYRMGQIMPIAVELTRSHRGYFRLRLCPRDDASVPVTQECFDQHRLYFVDANGTPLGSKYIIGDRTGWYRGEVALPSGVTCKRCVVQWQYKAGNTWGTCKNGTSIIGCGYQETFRACADIAIV